MSSAAKEIFGGGRRSSLVTEDAKSKDKLGVSNSPFGNRSSSVKVPSGHASFAKDSSKRQGSRDNLNSESGHKSLVGGGLAAPSAAAGGAKRNSSFRTGGSNPPPKPKPPPALAKPTSSSTSALIGGGSIAAAEASSKTNHTSSTSTSFTSKLSSKFGGAMRGQAAAAASSSSSSATTSPLSAGDSHRNAAVPASSAANAPAGEEVDGMDFDSIETGERLTHPTAARAKAPKRRPPSSVFVKESVSVFLGFFNFCAVEAWFIGYLFH